MDPNRAEAYVYIWEIVFTNSTANATYHYDVIKRVWGLGFNVRILLFTEAWTITTISL